jgi:hypothetical protein
VWVRWWTEHQGTDSTHRLRANWLERFLFFPHNTFCHFEHHHWPTVPSWNLPKARERYTGPEPIVTLKELLDQWAGATPSPPGVIRIATRPNARNRYTLKPPGLELRYLTATSEEGTTP